MKILIKWKMAKIAFWMVCGAEPEEARELENLLKAYS